MWSRFLPRGSVAVQNNASIVSWSEMRKGKVGEQIKDLFISKGCGNKSAYLQILAILWKYTDLLPHPLKININLFREAFIKNLDILWQPANFNCPLPTLPKGVPNMILVKVICYVNVENHFLTFTKHITFTRTILGTPF